MARIAAFASLVLMAASMAAGRPLDVPGWPCLPQAVNAVSQLTDIVSGVPGWHAWVPLTRRESRQQ